MNLVFQISEADCMVEGHITGSTLHVNTCAISGTSTTSIFKFHADISGWKLHQ